MIFLLSFLDLTLLGIYYIIKPIYLFFDTDETGFGAKDHALMISWFIHSANINKVVGFFTQDPFYFRLIAFGLMTVLLLFSLYIYYERRRLKKIIKIKRNVTKKILISTGSVLYSSLSIYFFFFSK